MGTIDFSLDFWDSHEDLDRVMMGLLLSSLAMAISLEHSTSIEIQRSFAPEILSYLEHQQSLFEQCRDRLMEDYSGEFIWFENGNVLDRDMDESVLFLRVSGAFPDRALFIAQVRSVEPKRSVRSAFLGIS